MTITVSTDGSALGNPNGPMGWSWADHDTHGADGHHHTGDCDAGGATSGTNQIGELCAVLEALRTHPGSEPLTIETDSQYAINCSTKWVHGWKKNGWKNSKKEPVKNAPLIKAIDREIRSRKGPVKFVWVKGHAGNAGNEKVDELARTYAEDARSGVRDGYLPAEGWQSVMDSPYTKGLEVPQDAQMLLDGELTAADYHDGRSMGGPGTMRDTDAATAPDTQGTQADTAARRPDDPIGYPTTHKAQETASTPDSATPSAQPAEAADPVTDGTAPAATHATQQQPSPTPVLAHTGLHVSGDVHITPPPASSPSFDGQPRRIRGYVEVDLLVEGDGSARLDDAPFLVAHLG